MNNYFMNITKNLDSKSSTVSDTKDIDQITGCFDEHINDSLQKENYRPVSLLLDVSKSL